MKGYIKITAKPAEKGNVTETDVGLDDVSFADKTCLLNAFLMGLDISHSEAALHLLALKEGMVQSTKMEDTVNE